MPDPTRKPQSTHSLSRRAFLARSVAAAAVAPATFHIVPRHCLGGPGVTAPSDTVGSALIGVGGQGPNTHKRIVEQFAAIGMKVDKRAECDVRFVGKADDKTTYTDFRRLLDRSDVDVVAIGTPPHWHGLISIAAAEAGKDVLCEKPMTRTIAEGRAVVEAFKRYGRVFQVGTFGRFTAAKEPAKAQIHKIMTSGLLKECPAVFIQRDEKARREGRGGPFKVKEWAGRPELPVETPPTYLDWDFYCGPAPLKPFVRPRHGGTHRQYWDYEGGGLSDMGQHYLDPLQWTYAKDGTSPVSIEASAPPAHPEVTGMWAWVEMKYTDGFTVVLDSGEWGEPYDRKQPRELKLTDLPDADQAKVKALPDPPPMLTFAEAVMQRKQAGGHAEAAHRAATLLNLANLAIRLGRKINYDPVKEQVVGDEQANRIVSQPMRAPWHL